MTTTESNTPDDARTALTPFTERGWVKHLGLDIFEAGGDRVRARWTITPEHHQPYGIVHGGVYCTVIETLASLAGALWFGDRGRVVGVSNQTDFLRAAREGVATADVTPVHRGRLQQVWLVEIRDETDRLLARGQVRLQNLETSDHLGRS